MAEHLESFFATVELVDHGPAFRVATDARARFGDHVILDHQNTHRLSLVANVLSILQPTRVYVHTICDQLPS